MREEGQSAVEIALMLPILLMLLFGIIIVAFNFFAFVQVSNATREAARAGSLYRLTVNNGASSSATLANTVQSAIYDTSSTPAISALGFLNPTAPNFNVTSDVVCKVNGSA